MGQQSQSPFEPHLRLSVIDPSRVLDLIDRYVMGPGGLQKAAAARRVEMHRAQFGKLINKLHATRRPIMLQTTVDRLLRALPAEARDELREAVLPVHALRLYEAWLDSALAAYGVGKAPREPRPTSAWNAVTAAELVSALKDMKIYAGYFAVFEREVRARWGAAESRRILLAECRAVAPLLVWWQVGGIERSAGELHGGKHGELGVYLRAALRAEAVLLRRRYATNRLHTVRARSTIAYEVVASPREKKAKRG